MGLKLFFAQQEGPAKGHSEKNGYVFGAHAHEDSIRNKDKRIPKTKKMYHGAVRRWMKFVEEQKIEGYKMGPGCATPDHTLIKEFIRWYAHTARGKKSKNGRPVMTSCLNIAERLFGGFEEIMQLTIVKEDRIEVFNWIRRTLSETEGTVENVEDPDHSFTKKDFLRVIASMWQVDNPRFMPGLLKATIMLALQLYLFTGARIGAFIPPHDERHIKGLRYEDIVLVLFPSPTGPWKVEWKVNQKWLKGNRNPDYAVFGIGLRDTKRPQFASGYFLLAMALQHGALFGIETVEDLAQYDLSNGRPIELRWKDEYLKKPVLRNITAAGPQDVPLTKERFCELLRGIVTTAGYSKNVTVHRIRKYLGSVIEGKHGSALVSQIYGHKDAGTYPKEYLLHCSSIDTVSAVLGEEEQSDHIDYFQGFERFYEHGYPGELPAEIEADILQIPELIEIRSRVEQLEGMDIDRASIATEKLKYRKALLRLRIAGLKEYQSHWVRERRDQRILNRGKEEPIISDNNVSTLAQSLIMPEIAKLSSLMSSDRELSFDEMLAFVDDLKTLCERDYDVFYLPQQNPVEDECPAEDCRKYMGCLKKHIRGAHIHGCVRRMMAVHLQVPVSDVKFCYECMKWFKKCQWREHCSSHLQSWGTQHCEVIVYRNTVIRPGYCPFCLWNKDLYAEDRLHQYLESANLKQHIEDKHIDTDQQHGARPVCGCGQVFFEERGLRHHLHDTHKLKNAIWLNPNPPRGKRKRNSKSEDRVSFADMEERSSKKFCTLTLGDFEKKSSTDSDSTKDDTSGSSMSCFSEEVSPLRSRPTTPGIEDFIDPRILEPLAIDKDQITPVWNPVSMEDCSSQAILEEQKLEDQQCRASPLISTKHQDSIYCSSKESKNYEIAINDTKEPTHSSQSNATRKTTDSARIQGDNQPVALTDNDKPRRKLSAKERRELRELKDQHLTLRQVGLNFPGIDRSLLQGAWVGMDISQQRCTRSRAKLRQS